MILINRTFSLSITTTPATLPDGEVLEDLHTRLAEKKVLPNQHFVDAGYVHAEIIAKSQEIHQIDSVGPPIAFHLMGIERSRTL